jgi:hypothetical protein
MRCKNCLKKLISGLSFRCRCGKELCIKCLDELKHDCSYDFKKEKIILEKVSMPKIQTI